MISVPTLLLPSLPAKSLTLKKSSLYCDRLA